jgi:uncharacterized protein (TIGR00255 family)
MTRSMTGFAHCERRTEAGVLTWELRAVNHRYLDVGVRMPEDFRALEPTVRELISGHVVRGKVEASLRFRAAEDAVSTLHVNTQLLDAVLAHARRLAAQLPDAAPLDPLRLLAWPGVVVEPERDLAPVQEAALALLGEAVAVLRESREREGAKIAVLLRERCAAIRAAAARVAARLPEVEASLRERLMKRVTLLVAEPDPARLEQEFVILAQRLDVAEELDRLEAHVTEVEHTLDRAEAVGRRLDFLMQELNREANTLASKAQDAETTRAAVEIKVLIEQMREQVQNLE